MLIEWDKLLEEAKKHLDGGGLSTQIMMENFLKDRLQMEGFASKTLAERLAFFYAQSRHGYVENAKLEGCLLGGAVGDALGYPVEFYDWREIQFRLGENGVEGYQNPELALISDDTQMTLFTAEGLIRSAYDWEEAELEDYVRLIHQGYLDWYLTQKQGYLVDKHSWWSELRDEKGLYHQRAPGTTCLTALASGKCGTFDLKLNNSKGCGGVMRVAPIGAYFAQKTDVEYGEIAYLAGRAAAITHSHPLGYIPAGFFAVWIAFLLRGESLERGFKRAKTITKCVFANEKDTDDFLGLLDLAKEYAELDIYRERVEEIIYNPETIERLGGGWVAEEAMAIAVYSVFRYPNSFEKAVLTAVNHSGDSDSTGSITGNIMGAFYGVNAIPAHLLKGLELRNLIARMARRLKQHELL